MTSEPPPRRINRIGPLSSLSSLSLPRPEGTHESRRRLLLIYIHGFMGSEASFHDLPAHVHDLLTNLLSESHVVYTRIYPRYKSHGELRTAVSQFSAWLSPHEAEDLDVILLGHSLGGILAADVALMQEDEKPKHRILGLVNFDAPFLGLHPRVIPTGIMGSIPRKDIPEDKLAGEQESLGLGPTYKPVAPSPNFDPPFTNDVRLAERGFLKGMMHFVNKNTDNLSRSIFDRIVSPVKFANCVNNYSELRRRHRRLIALENAELSPDRVRFVNYYTTSTGRYPRKGKPKPKTDEALEQMDQITISSSQERSATPSIFSEAETTTATTMTSESANDDHEPALKAPSEVSLVIDESELEPELDSEKTIPSLSPEITSTESIPSLDQKESPPDSDKAPDTLSPPSETAPTPKHKLRKFILLPSNHWRYNDNSHWTPILMEDMDEVLAHQSMFIPQGANYDFLVGDTVALIEQWVQSDLSRRLLQESLD